MLGRAGRPGFDVDGEGILLAKNKEQIEYSLPFLIQTNVNTLIYYLKPSVSSYNFHHPVDRKINEAQNKTEKNYVVTNFS